MNGVTPEALAAIFSQVLNAKLRSWKILSPVSLILEFEDEKERRVVLTVTPGVQAGMCGNLPTFNSVLHFNLSN